MVLGLTDATKLFDDDLLQEGKYYTVFSEQRKYFAKYLGKRKGDGFFVFEASLPVETDDGLTRALGKQFLAPEIVKRFVVSSKEEFDRWHNDSTDPHNYYKGKWGRFGSGANSYVGRAKAVWLDRMLISPFYQPALFSEAILKRDFDELKDSFVLNQGEAMLYFLNMSALNAQLFSSREACEAYVKKVHGLVEIEGR